MSTKHALILHALVPVRAQASETAEQITQLLFGQVVDVLDEQPRWLLVRNTEDQQTGWADRKMISVLSDEEYASYTAADKHARVSFPLAYAVSLNNGQTLPLTMSTVLPDYANGQFSVLGVSFRIDPSMVVEQALELNETNLQQVCRFLINVPYLWGGKNAMGMDCSGFTQVVMSLFGILLPRNASQQAQLGKQVPNLQHAQAGDLCFFCHPDSSTQAITHVGILLNPQTLIHCSGRVHIASITEQGLPTHRLLQIRRYN